MTLKRNWTEARRAKSHLPCRACGYRGKVELAHLIPRRFDRRVGSTAYVHPSSVVPLCVTCHDAYDENQGLDLWVNLTDSEKLWVVERIGYGEARRRVSGRNWSDEINACNEAA